ncbi:MAG: SDR family oxidoreductase [Bacteroidota bacterium]
METPIALVTGASRGLGLETTRQLAQKGYQVILSCRNTAKGEAAIQGWKDVQDQIVVHELEINSEESVQRMLAFVQQTYGRLDVLVNNAAINYDTWQNALDADLAEVHQTIETNVFGAWRMIQAFAPLFQQQQRGCIVNVSSGAGAMTGMQGGTPGYSLSKAALNVLTIKAAHQLGQAGIKVNSVCPGWVRTDMGGASAPRSVAEGAKGIVWAATLASDGPSGGFFRDGKAINW